MAFLLRTSRGSRFLNGSHRDVDASARSRARRCRPGAEGLEDRRLLAAIAESALPAGDFPAGIAPGPDGNLWFSEQPFANQVDRITPSGVVTRFPVSTTHQNFVDVTVGPYTDPYPITAGPDGNLWFTETSPGAIDRITPSGAVTEFPLPDPQAVPLGITAGPDGNVWFTEQGKIGRITPAGVITEFPLSGAFDVPFGITAGPDGNLWFTEAVNSSNPRAVYSGAIGRITPAGVIDKFSVTLNDLPVGITTGPDGNLWFTLQGGGVEAISTSGTLQGQEIPTPRAGAITLGGDGNLWAAARDQVLRITTAGTVTAFRTPTLNSGVSAITTGPGGDLWFSESLAGRVGQVVLNPPGDAPLTAQGTGPVSIDEEVAFSGAVASFTDADPNTSSGDYVAQIDWGDGTTTNGTIASDGHGGFTVSGEHTYAKEGTDTVTATIFDTKLGNPGATATATVMVTVAEASLVLAFQTPSPFGFFTRGVSMTAVLANAPGKEDPDEVLTATIDWGDSTPTSSGTVINNRNGFVSVLGTHTYAAVGNYHATVTLHDDNLTSMASGTLNVRNPVVSNMGASALHATEGVPFGPTEVASFFGFTGANGPGSLYRATIQWGDGTTSAGSFSFTSSGDIVSPLSGFVEVLGSHVYAKPGTYSDTITVDNGGASPVSATGTVTVTGPALTLSGSLSPASDSGASNHDGITAVTRPTFVGATLPGAVVKLSAYRWDGSPAVSIAAVTADASGHWSATSKSLSAGTYTIVATATAPDGRKVGPRFLSPRPVVIETAGPRVAGAVLDPGAGQLRITFRRDRAGLDAASLLHTADYVLTRQVGARLVPLPAASVRLARGRSGDLVATLNLGHRLSHGRYLLRVVSGDVVDLAGNALDGEFRGALPSGEGHPGGDFTAQFLVRGRPASALPLSPPLHAQSFPSGPLTASRRLRHRA